MKSKEPVQSVRPKLPEVKTEFIEYVPRDTIENNLGWRIFARERALKDPEVRDALYDASMIDPLFLFNAHLWCYEPRSKQKIKPFVTWPHQDGAILKMDEVIEKAEEEELPTQLLLQKSRAQGGTVCYLGVFIRRWLRDDMFSAGLVTRNEDLVDSSTDTDTLLWKVSWMLDMLPFWLLPAGYDKRKHRNLTDHSIINPVRGGTFVGYAAGQDVGRGGRKTVFAADEIGAADFIKGGKDYAVMDSLTHVTNCVFLVSTFGADSGMFYEKCEGDSGSEKLILDWKDNPTQNRLMYKVVCGVPVAMDVDDQPGLNAYWSKNQHKIKHLERRGFSIEGTLRSPWYDAMCTVAPNPRSVAKELDMNPRGAVGKVFDVGTLDRMKENCCQPPVFHGRAVFDEETLKIKGLIQQEGGPLKLWFKPSVDSRPPTGSYVIGCDIASGGTGEYSSNSTAIGINQATREQVIEYAVRGLPGAKFAKVVVAICRWLYDAYLGWEASGASSPFATAVLVELNYGNVYYRDVTEVGSLRKTQKPGWWNGSDDDKGMLFESMCLDMEEGRFIPRSHDLIRECGEYEWEKGKIIHRLTQVSGVAGKAHGDRCVGGGVACLLLRDRPSDHFDTQSEITHNPPYGSFAWRQLRDEEAERNHWTDDEPQMTLTDLLRLS